MSGVTPHDVNCPHRDRDHDDAAKRCSDQYALHLIGAGQDAVGSWFAVALADGRSDGVLYPSKRAAVRHQHHNEFRYAFIRIGPASMSVCEAAEYLATNRALYDKGLRLPDPDHRAGGLDMIPRLTAEDQRNQVASILSGGRRAPSNLLLPTPGDLSLTRRSRRVR